MIIDYFLWSFFYDIIKHMLNKTLTDENINSTLTSKY